MRTIEVKTTRELKKLADEFMDEIAAVVNFSKNVIVKRNESSEKDEIRFVVYSEGTFCNIITGAVVERIMEVVNWYIMRYMFSISYYVDIINIEGKDYPAFSFTVKKYVEK